MELWNIEINVDDHNGDGVDLTYMIADLYLYNYLVSDEYIREMNHTKIRSWMFSSV